MNFTKRRIKGNVGLYYNLIEPIDAAHPYNFKTNCIALITDITINYQNFNNLKGSIGKKYD